MKLIVETMDLNNNFEILNEANTNGGKTWKIKGPFLEAEVVNANKRIYPKEILKREIDSYNEKYIKTNSAYGELDHPPTPQLNLDRVSHIVESLSFDKNTGYGVARIIDTPMGKIAQNILAGGGRLGVSTRGVGTVDENNRVNEDFRLLAIDIVANPSAPNAYVDGILESKEWVLDGNIILEKAFEDFERRIASSSKRQNIMSALQQFLSEI